jgi:NADPH:quinone reductase-like Zn-dependent oxidoreductase
LPIRTRNDTARHRAPAHSAADDHVDESKETTMKRIQFHRYGGPEVMQFEDFEPQRPGAGQVLIRVRAAAANPYDEKGVTTKPAGLSFVDAAALPTVVVAALQALTGKGKLQPGHSVFVHGCLGGVGRAAVQIALARGATVVGGSCRASGAREARDLGVSPVVEFASPLASLTGRFDIVFDTVGTLSRTTARRLLGPGGRIVDVVPSATKFVRSALPGLELNRKPKGGKLIFTTAPAGPSDVLGHRA